MMTRLADAEARHAQGEARGAGRAARRVLPARRASHLAMTNLYQLYYTVAWNRRLAAANDARANAVRRSRRSRNSGATRRLPTSLSPAQRRQVGRHDVADPHRLHHLAAAGEGRDAGGEARTLGTPAVGKATKQIRFKPYEHSDGPGTIGIDATRFSRCPGRQRASRGAWFHILGRGLGAVTAFPQGRPPTSQDDAVFLEYDVNVPDVLATLTVALHLLPTLNTSGGVDVRVGVSIDDGDMQTAVDAPDAVTRSGQDPGTAQLGTGRDRQQLRAGDRVSKDQPGQARLKGMAA